MIDRLIPRDEYPGARDAGVDAYILRRCTSRAADRKPTGTGLAELHLAALERLGRAFNELTLSDQEVRKFGESCRGTRNSRAGSLAFVGRGISRHGQIVLIGGEG